MRLKFSAFVAVISLVGVLGLFIRDVSRMSPETLILCSLNEGGILIPGIFCEYYMYNHRDVESDVNRLASGSGLSFILEGKDKNKVYEIAEFYILKGLDVDSVNPSGGHDITPLHGAVLDNDAAMARFLLSHGASKSVVAPTLNMSPLELAHTLQEKDPNVDRSEIEKILMD